MNASRRGGMGVVYRARRVDGVFDQEVAVKRVRAETATREMRVRFEFERQARARLNQPNIATVLDGATTEGTPLPGPAARVGLARIGRSSDEIGRVDSKRGSD